MGFFFVGVVRLEFLGRGTAGGGGCMEIYELFFGVVVSLLVLGCGGVGGLRRVLGFGFVGF